MDLRRKAAQERGDAGQSGNYLDAAGFDASSLGVRIAELPASALNTNSRGYVLQASRTLVKRIYTDTSFGTVLIDEHIGGKVYADADPDLVIVGQPAWSSTIKYVGGKWATTIAVDADNGRALIVQADRRFDDQAQDAFVSFVRALILSTY